MSDPHDEDPINAVLRAAIPGRPTGLSPRPKLPFILAPGRTALEVSVLSSALAILIPVFSVIAIAAAVVARKSGNTRWLAALIAGAWCGVLGLAVRSALGAGAFP